MKESITVISIIIAIVIFCIIGWRIDRWINWKFSYGNKVEQRIEKLEQRVENIEKRLDNSG